MKNFIRKSLTCFMISIMTLISVFTLVACGTNSNSEDSASAKVMEVDLNPSLEFVLNENDIVITVSATNDDGYYILAQSNFVGLSATEAVNLFIEKAEELGFIVSSSYLNEETNNKIEISISGDNAKLYSSIESSLKAKIDELEITAEIEFSLISKDDLQELVSECMQELSETEISALSEGELISLIETSRTETENIQNQISKEFYYLMRSIEISNAELNAIFTAIHDTENQLLQNTISLFSLAYSNFTTSLSTYTQSWTNYYFGDESLYTEAMNAYIEAKNIYLEFNKGTYVGELTFEQIKSAVETAKTYLDEVRSSIESTLESQMTIIDSYISQLSTYAELLSSLFDENTIESAISSAKSNFAENFESNAAISNYITINFWINEE